MLLLTFVNRKGKPYIQSYTLNQPSPPRIFGCNIGKVIARNAERSTVQYTVQYKEDTISILKKLLGNNAVKLTHK
jgi:hypothetical protein